MSIFDVRHQPRAQRILQRALACGRVPHAYLFHGPEGVGRERLAIRLATVMLCEHPVETRKPPHPELADFDGVWRDACGKCKDCMLIRADTHPDLHRVYRELRKHHPDSTVRQRVSQELGVDVIRHFLLDAVAAKPFRGRAKVFIVRDADWLTTEAQNALLKTLEEPPRTTFLILISAGLNDLLPTTRSRCQHVPFSPLPSDFVAARLADLAGDLSKDQARKYASLAHGSLGTALRFAEDGVAAYQDSVDSALREIGRLVPVQLSKRWHEEAKGIGEAFSKRDPGITDTEAQRRGLKLIFSLVASALDTRLHGTVSSRADASGSVAGIAQAIQAVAEAERHIDQNANVQLAVDALVIRLGRLLA
jgi:DNA polymerase-3 subunit delta'